MPRVVEDGWLVELENSVDREVLLSDVVPVELTCSLVVCSVGVSVEVAPVELDLSVVCGPDVEPVELVCSVL